MTPDEEHQEKTDSISLGSQFSTQWEDRVLRRRSNYELFNRSNGDIHLESWNYRGCWHQTCPLIDPR